MDKGDKQMGLRRTSGIALAALLAISSVWADSHGDPVVGGSIMAVNVEMVATTGYRASQLLGSDIYNDQGESIGKLDDFIVGSDERVSVAVLAVGGFLGVGARLVAVPASLLQGNDKGQTVLPGGSKAQLEALPAFNYAQ